MGAIARAMARTVAHTLGGRAPSLATGLPLAWPDPQRLADRMAAALAYEVDDRRGFLWLPVAFAAGIALYFAAETEPALPLALSLAALLAGLAFWARARAGAFQLLAILATVAAGFALATAHTARIAHPVLARTLVAAELSGFVERADIRGEGSRIVLRLTALKPSGRTPLPEAVPERARVTLRGAAPAVGEHVTLRATLGPPPGPAYPGGFDFGRDAWFEGIGATGYALGAPHASPTEQPEPAGLAMAAWLERLRHDIAARIGAVLHGENAAIAAALVTGLRGGVGERAEEAMRISGLSHILSISGLHMALVATTAFYLARALLALSPALALRHPIKAWAAVPAIFAATFYLVLSGNEVPTQRSYVMALLVLAGVMLGRPALTLRTLALAALIVLACAPATLLDPGTQMSFAATLALVAAHERFGRRLLSGAGVRGGQGWSGTVLRAVLAVALTSLVAGLATAPFAAFHFQRAAPYGLLANLCAIPLVSFVVMPAGLIGALLLPLGLDGPAWRAMGWGIEGMLWVADRVAALPGADRGIPAFPLAALVCLSLSLVAACLLRTRLVLVAPLFAGGALILAWNAPRPVLLVDAAGRTVAVRGADGTLALMGDRPPEALAQRFAAGQWRNAEGEAPGRVAPGDPTAPAHREATPAPARDTAAAPGEATKAARTNAASASMQQASRGTQALGGTQSLGGTQALDRTQALDGVNASGGVPPSAGVAAAAASPGRASCDALGCVLAFADGRLAALSLSRDSLVDDCRLAAVLVTPFEPPKDCAAHVVRTDPRGEGAALALYPAAPDPAAPSDGRPSGFRRVDARPQAVSRPWLPAPVAARPPPRAAKPLPDPATSADTQALPPASRLPVGSENTEGPTDWPASGQ